MAFRGDHDQSLPEAGAHRRSGEVTENKGRQEFGEYDAVSMSHGAMLILGIKRSNDPQKTREKRFQID